MSDFEKMVYWLNYRPECPEVADVCYLYLVTSKYPSLTIEIHFVHKWVECTYPFDIFIIFYYVKDSLSIINVIYDCMMPVGRPWECDVISWLQISNIWNLKLKGAVSKSHQTLEGYLGISFWAVGVLWWMSVITLFRLIHKSMQMKLAHGPFHAGYTKRHIWGYNLSRSVLETQLLKKEHNKRLVKQWCTGTFQQN